MNVLQMGPHASADWLRIKARAYHRASVFVSPGGQLVAVAARTAKPRPGFRHIGDYTPAATYAQVVNDLATVAQELQQASAA
jgi:hypothetical protein